MKTNKILKSLVFICLLCMVSVAGTFAAAGLNVVLANQNPDPVTPGNFVYLNVKLSNVGDVPIEEAVINFKPNNNFKVAQGEEISKNLGTISSYSTDSTDSSVIAKYKIYVDEDTPLGLNTVSFDVVTNGGTFNYDFSVLVEDSNPLVLVKDISTSEVSPGEDTTLKVSIQNINSISLRNVKVALNLADVDGKIISMAKGSNEKIIESLNPQESMDIEYEISISPDATSKSYLLPVKITYEDTLENSFENTLYGSVKVYSKPVLSLNLDSQEIYTVGKGKFSLAIANPGSSKIKGVQLKILDSDDYEIIEGANQYVGDLNPDDFQTLQGQVYIKNPDNAVLKVQLKYADSYENKNEETRNIPLKLYSDADLIRLGLKTQSSSSGTYIFLLLVVVIVVGIWLWRRNKGSRSKK